MATTDVVGLFAEKSFRLGETVTLDAGLRWDRASASVDGAKASTDLAWAYHGTRATDRTDSLPGGSLRARWRAADGLEISLGAGTAARIPEPQERWFSLKRMGTDWVGNPDLDPSRNTALDLSASFRAGRLYVSAYGFLNEVDDYVVLADVKKVNAVPGVMNPMARTYENVDARLAGGEATAGWGIANPRAGVAFGDVGRNVGVENLFGRLYSEHLSDQRDPFRSGVEIPEPGRNAFVNLSWRS